MCLEARTPCRFNGWKCAALSLIWLGLGCHFLPLDTELPAAKQDVHPVNFRDALVYVERANAVYLAAQAPGALSGEVVNVPRSSVQYVLQREPGGRQHVAIRGTANLQNVLVDSQLVPDHHQKLGIVLHRGFAQAAEELYADIGPRLSPADPITLTGHSLGGALATILAMLLDTDGFQVERVVTFGQPKVTNHEGAERFSRLPILRFVNDDDPVADLPPAVLSTAGRWKYAHLGPEVILRGDREYVYLEPHQVAGRSLSSFYQQLGDHELKDHKIALYRKQLVRRQDGGRELPAAP